MLPWEHRCGFHQQARPLTKHPSIFFSSLQPIQHINSKSIQWQTNTTMLKTSQPSTPQVGTPSSGFHAFLITCKGYKPAAGKSVDEYRNLDAGDESLARWKASLGLDSATSGDKNGPKVALCIIDFPHCFHLSFT